MKNLDYHAKLIVHGFPAMNRTVRKRLVKWLLAQAKTIELAAPEDYANTWNARLMK